MNDIEAKEVFRQKAIDLINEYRQQGGDRLIYFLPINTPEISAFIRSIQLHEKTKQEFADFKQEVSDAVVLEYRYVEFTPESLQSFIIPKLKPDPLVDVFDECFNQVVLEGETWSESMARKTRAALEARWLEIREKSK